MSRALTIGIAVLVLIGALAVLGFINDPFGWRKAKEQRLEAQADASASNSVAREVEAQGERETVQRVVITVRQVQAATTATAALSDQARTAADANQPIASDRLARLREHDERLCAIARLDGCPAATDDAANGGGPVQPLPSPRGSQGGRP